MRASDVMVHDLVTVRPETDLAEAVALLGKHDVSALPVVDEERNLIGILSEADLIHRVEIGTEKHRPWWLEAVTGASMLAAEFAKAHGKKVGEVMTREVVSTAEDSGPTPHSAHEDWPVPGALRAQDIRPTQGLGSPG